VVVLLKLDNVRATEVSQFLCLWCILGKQIKVGFAKKQVEHLNLLYEQQSIKKATSKRWL